MSDRTRSEQLSNQTIAGDSQSGAAAVPARESSVDSLLPGQRLGRYEIIRTLGEGGMGAVYQARDNELERIVALKVIRPSLLQMPSALQRFKQETVLSQRITHRNVIRLYDIGEAGGLKFITMEYLEGQDLQSLLRRHGKFTPVDAAGVMKQVLRGLEAIHQEGVVHRDLKPANIMQDVNGRIVVMDFGLARGNDSAGMTQTGALLGTLEYMSPEQANGRELDARSDLFTVGLIFYELLTGQTPYKADSAIGSLMKRAQEPARPASEVDASVPRTLSAIVARCLQPDPAKRYGSAAEMLAEVERWDQPSSAIPFHPSRITLPAVRASSSWPLLLSGVLAVILIAAAVWYFVAGRPRAPLQHAPVSLLIADFENKTQDGVFDGTLEPALGLALEGAPFITSYSRGAARKEAAALRSNVSALDEQTARLVATRDGISMVVAGSVESDTSGGFTLGVRAMDAVTGKVIASSEVHADSKDAVLKAVGKLATSVRAGLGDTTPASAQLAAQETFTASSLDAAHEYAVGQEFSFAGKQEEAIRSFTKAAELDPNLGRAYAGIGIAYFNLHRPADGEKYFKLAMTHIDRMTDRERLRTRGSYYLMMGDQQKCVDELTLLVNQYPADSAGHTNLAICHSNLRNMPKAMEEARRAAAVYPRHPVIRNNAALIADYAGDFKNAERDARAAEELNPSYPKAYMALAFAQMGQGEMQAAEETYRKLEKISASGAAYAALGESDLAMYEGRYSDAAAILEKAAAEDVLRAEKLIALAAVQLLRQDSSTAVRTAESAVTASQTVRTRFLAARIFVEAGQMAKARAIATQLSGSLEPGPQAYARLIEGGADIKEGNARAAITEIIAANKLLDTWIGHFDLGRAYLAAGAFTEADSEFDRCMHRRGEALTLFFDEVPTFGYFPVIYYYQGSVRQGLKSAEFAESYRTYLNIRGKAGEDPLLTKVRALM